MKCCIVGAGATGGFLAVKLGLAGHHVSVIVRRNRLEPLQMDGLSLLQDGITYHHTPIVADSSHGLGVQDVVFITTKATALASIAEYLPELIGPSTRVVFLQNGMTWWYPLGQEHRVPSLREFELASVFLPHMRIDQVYGGIVYTANIVERIGVIRNNSPRHNAIELDSVTEKSSPETETIRQLLIGAGIDSPPVVDLRRALWLKLIGNASSSSLSVATGNPSAIVDDKSIQSLFIRMVEEVSAVAASHGYNLNGQLDIKRWTEHRKAHKPSMLQDFEAGRLMEIEQIILAPVAFARESGVPTPTLDAVTAIVARLAIDKGLYDNLS